MKNLTSPSFLKRGALVLGLLLVVSVSARSARADAIYAYLGYDYTYADGSYTISMSVSGDFTAAMALGPNLVDYIVTPLTFDFVNGLYDFTNLNTVYSSFQVDTDNSGNITGTDIQLRINLPPFQGSPTFSLVDLYSPGGDHSFDYLANGFVYYLQSALNSTPGVWSEEPAPAPTPEPATAALALTALLASLFVAHWRKSRELPDAPL